MKKNLFFLVLIFSVFAFAQSEEENKPKQWDSTSAQMCRLVIILETR